MERRPPMSKRLTDSEKWQDPWFAELPQEDKLLWLYLLDACDHAGVWKVNVRFLNFSLGSTYTLETITKALGSRVYRISSEYLLIEKYLQFQHPKGLSDTNKPQKAAMDVLLKHNVLDRVIEGYGNPYHTSQDKDKDKDQDKDQDKDKDTGFELDVDSPPEPEVDPEEEFLEALWNASPGKSRNRSSKKEVKQEWRKIPKKDRPPFETVMESLLDWVRCPDWTKEGGKYATGLHRWIKACKWESSPDHTPEEAPKSFADQRKIAAEQSNACG